jgi:hypothetical protein
VPPEDQFEDKSSGFLLHDLSTATPSHDLLVCKLA